MKNIHLVWLGLLSLCTLSFVHAQASFQLPASKQAPNYDLSTHFTSYELVSLDVTALYEFRKANPGTIELSLIFAENDVLSFELSPHDIRSADYIRQVQHDSGLEIQPRGEDIATYRGQRLDRTKAAAHFTMDESFVLGRWVNGDETVQLEPLWRLEEGAPRDLYILYTNHDVVPIPGGCGTQHQHQPVLELHEQMRPTVPAKMIGECKDVEIALASDWQLFQDFGSEGATENFMLGVLADVQTNYDDEFDDELIFVVVTTFISDCANCDPWTTSTSAGILLDDFVDWGNGGGFGNVEYDVATLWTGRNLAGSTIGVAYLSAVCGFRRYNVCQNFTTNSESLRVLWSHELGHNFGSGHDPSGSFTIMAPSVNTSTVWSAQSQNAINNFVSVISCLDPCGSGGDDPPVAEIYSPDNVYCVGSLVPLFDESTGGLADSWFWDMPGATPGTSTQQHPTVTFDEPGTYTVTLFADNDFGGDQASFRITISENESSTNFIEYENFENGIGWDVDNPDGRITWSLAEAVGNPGTLSAYMNNFGYTGGSGQRDALISPEFDLSIAIAPMFSFDYAYSRRSNGANDILRVYASVDGGNTFPFILYTGRETGGGGYATAGPLGTAFFPADQLDWCGVGGCIEIDLTEYEGEENFVLKIENQSGVGNNLFVDNLALSTACITIDPPIADFTPDPTIGCAPLEVTFTDRSIGEFIDFWEWDMPGATPEFSNDQNPTVIYTEPGSYDVSLYVENPAGGDFYFLEGAVEVLGAPVGDFTFVVNDFTVNFTGTADASVFDYSWNFGDGNTSMEQSPTHTYDAPGTYTVVYTIFNGCQSVNITKEVVIESPLAASFTATPQTGCAPLGVQFQSTSTGTITSYNWTFPGGSPGTSNEANPMVTYNTPGVYSVTLEVSDGTTTETTTTANFITVNGLPNTTFTATLPPGETSPTIINNTTDADSYLWDFGDGNMSTDAMPMHTYEEAGTYTITLTGTNVCGSTTATQTVEVILPVDPSFTVSRQSGCAPFTSVFTASPMEDGLTYTWTFEGGYPATSTNPTVNVIYGVPGTYTVTLTITNAAGASTVTEEDFITVNTTPDVAFVATSTPGDLTVTLANQSTNADSYLYTFGDGNSSADNPASYTYGAAGDYTITLAATNECGTVETTQDVAIIMPVSPSFTSSTANGCTPHTVNFVAAPQEPGLTYAWTFAGGTPENSSDPNPEVVYNAAGTYAVSLTITNAAGAASTESLNYVTVEAGPTANFNASVVLGSPTVDFNNTSTDAVSYSWDFGDDSGSTMTSPSHTYDASGTYEVVLTAQGDCGTNVTRQTVTVILPPAQPTITVDATEGCTPFSVNYSTEMQEEGVTYSWEFPGGDPATADTRTAAVVYNTAGTYNATLTVANAAGERMTSTTTAIVVGSAPSASITTAYETGDLDVTFTANTTAADAWAWNFGDGETADGMEVTHTYADAGTYEVTLQASNACGLTTVTETVTIILAPKGGFTADRTSGCDPMMVTFSSEDAGEGLVYAWTFENGEPATSNEAMPTVMYNTPGSHNVTLRISNAAGEAVSTEENFITVGTVPVNTFVVTSELGNLTVTLTADDASADSWMWNLGDGNTATGQTVTHTYDEDGDYTVTLTTTNSCGEVSSSQEVNLLLPPTATIVTTTQTVCAGDDVMLSAQETGDGLTYAWALPGGTPDMGSTQSVTTNYATAGTYTAELTVSNAAGSSMSSTEIVVLAAPAAGFSFTTNGLTADFMQTAGVANSYTWNFADLGTSDEANPSFTFPATGTYAVSLMVTNDCGTDTFITDVDIEGQAPQTDFTATNNEGCGPLTVTFMNQTSGADSYSWQFPGGDPTSSDDENPVVTYATPGNYQVILVATNVFGSSTRMIMDMIEVLPATAASFDYTLDVTTAIFTQNSTAATGYRWLIDGTEVGTGETLEYTFPGNGTYEVRLETTGVCNDAVDVQTITIDGPLPSLAFDTDQNIGCTPLAVQFTDSSTESPTSWNWTFSGGEPATSSDQNPLVTYNAAGTYAVTLAATNAYGTTTQEWMDYVVVGAAPVVNGINTTTDDGANYTFSPTEQMDGWTYLWTMPDGSTQNTAEATYTFDANGEYTVILVVTNPCGDVEVSDTFMVVINSTNAPAWSQHLRVFPNPTTDLVHLQATNWPAKGKMHVQLYNVLGQPVRQEYVNLVGGSWQQSLDLNNLPAGTYHLELRWGAEQWTSKLIKL